jgi:hypothetical protein
MNDQAQTMSRTTTISSWLSSWEAGRCHRPPWPSSWQACRRDERQWSFLWLLILQK